MVAVFGCAVVDEPLFEGLWIIGVCGGQLTADIRHAFLLIGGDDGRREDEIFVLAFVILILLVFAWEFKFFQGWRNFVGCEERMVVTIISLWCIIILRALVLSLFGIGIVVSVAIGIGVCVSTVGAEATLRYGTSSPLVSFQFRGLAVLCRTFAASTSILFCI